MVDISRYGWDGDMVFWEAMPEPGRRRFQFFREPVRHLILLYFAKRDEMLKKVLSWLENIKLMENRLMPSPTDRKVRNHTANGRTNRERILKKIPSLYFCITAKQIRLGKFQAGLHINGYTSRPSFAAMSSALIPDSLAFASTVLIVTGCSSFCFWVSNASISLCFFSIF